MPFVPFREHFPDLADRETRSVTVFEGSRSALPAGDYGFHELYCDEPGCDCPRVLLSVYSTAGKRPEAVIGYGWESSEFYAAWMKDDDPKLLAELKGPALNLGSPQSELAPAILALARRSLLNDEPYVARLKRHYALFRKKIEERSGGRTTHGMKIAGNDPCPCGSDRMYKMCCLRDAGEPRAVNEPVPGSSTVDRDPQLRSTRMREVLDTEVRITDEVEYVVCRAAERSTHVVRLGQLVLFSTATGDAWMLDPDDGLALPLARSGDRLPLRILETDERFVVEWTHDYRVDGETFFVVERKSGTERMIVGYPTDELVGP